MNTSQVFDKYSESVGHLVMTEDGAVTNVSWFSHVIAELNVLSHDGIFLFSST